MEIAPIIIETKKNEEIKLKEEKLFKIESNNKNNFNIILKNGISNIILYANTQKELINKEYEKIYYLEDLKNNKF